MNAEGKATRRLFYRDDKLSKREYHDHNGYNVSAELFSSDDYITESIQHGSLARHWWYKQGVPVKYARGEEIYLKDGDRWIAGKYR